MRGKAPDQWGSEAEARGPMGGRGGVPGRETNGRESRRRGAGQWEAEAGRAGGPGAPEAGPGTRKTVGAGSRTDNLSNPLWDERGHAPPRARAPPPCQARRAARGPGRRLPLSARAGWAAGTPASGARRRAPPPRRGPPLPRPPSRRSSGGTGTRPRGPPLRMPPPAHYLARKDPRAAEGSPWPPPRGLQARGERELLPPRPARVFPVPAPTAAASRRGQRSERRDALTRLCARGRPASPRAARPLLRTCSSPGLQNGCWCASSA